MIGLKTIVASALLAVAAATPASAQLPAWAASDPGSFEAQYPNRDVLNGGALTPAGRMDLELSGDASPVFGPRDAYGAMDRAAASSYVPRYHSYPQFRAFRGNRHSSD